MNYNKNIRGTDNSQMTNLLKYNGADETTVSFEQEVRRWFGANAKRMRGLCGSEEDAGRLLLAALNSVHKVPTLMECTFDSFARCLLTSAEYRLYPGAMAECAYVPFNNNKLQCKEATFMLMYPGICQLLYRTGVIKDIEAEVVCSRDLFDYVRGSNRKLVFEPYDGGLEERGEWLGVYCIIRNIYGGEHIKYVTAKEIESIKNRSRAAAKPDSPWNSKEPLDRAWMWMKTALKQNKFVPRSATVAAALELDSDNQVQDDNIIPVQSSSPRTATLEAARTQPAAIPHNQSQAIEIPVVTNVEKSLTSGAKNNAV